MEGAKEGAMILGVLLLLLVISSAKCKNFFGLSLAHGPWMPLLHCAYSYVYIGACVYRARLFFLYILGTWPLSSPLFLLSVTAVLGVL